MITVDIFPVNKAAVPDIKIYKLETSENKNEISGKLVYRLRKEFGGHWAANYGRIFSDISLTDKQLNNFLGDLWASTGTPFGNVQTITRVVEPVLTEYDIANFVAKGMLSDQNLQRDINTFLNRETAKIRNAEVKKVVDFNAFVISNVPSISISVSSNILLEKNMDQFIRDGNDPMHLYTKVAHQSTKGEITSIVGVLKEERERLKKVAQDELTIKKIESSPDDTTVLCVKVGQKDYHYAATSLEIVLTMQNCSRFNVSSNEISKYTKINPAQRYKIIQRVKNLVNERFLTNTKLIGNSYESDTNPDLFPCMFKVPFEEPLMIGKQESYPFKSIKYGLQQYGLYKTSAKLVGNKIRVGVMYPADFEEKQNMLGLLDMIKSELKTLSFEMVVSNFVKFNLSDESSLERNVDSLVKDGTDIIICVLPDEFYEDDDYEANGIYRTFKRLTITRGIGGQVVTYKTLTNKNAAFNIVLGILGKTGNIPYILSKPLEFCDVVVGIDIARQKKTRLPGSNNAAAIARVYFNDGNFLKYVIHDAPLDGETVPAEVMKSLFPLNEFQGKRVVVHRDGYFRGDEIKTLIKWGDSIGAQFSLIEVIKRQTPRIYEMSKDDSVMAPKKGTVFMLDDSNSLLISSPPPFKGATPRPLKIQIKYGSIGMLQAVRTILSLTELHYGSINPPRLPVTIHYSDQIAWFALRGIKPPNLIGEIPFWL